MKLHPDSRRAGDVEPDLVTRRETYEIAHRVPEAWARPGTTLAIGDPRWKALTAIVGVLGGAALIVFGVVAVARGDLDGSFNLPIVEVAGWPHSPLLGILEIAAGVALVIVSLSSIGELLVSAVIAGFGVIAIVEPQVLDNRLSIASMHAWLLVGIGGVGLLAALVAYVMSATRAQREADVTAFGL